MPQTFVTETENVNPEFKIEEYKIDLRILLPEITNPAGEDEPEKRGTLKSSGWKIQALSPALRSHLSPKQQEFIASFLPPAKEGESSSISEPRLIQTQTLSIFKSVEDFKQWVGVNKATLREVNPKSALADVITNSGRDHVIALLLPPDLVESLDAQSGNAAHLVPSAVAKIARGGEGGGDAFGKNRREIQGRVAISGKFASDSNQITLNSLHQRIVRAFWTPAPQSLKRYQEAFHLISTSGYGQTQSQGPFFVPEQTMTSRSSSAENKQQLWERFMEATSVVANPTMQTVTFNFSGKGTSSFFKLGESGTLTIQYVLTLQNGKDIKGNGIYYHEGTVATQFEPTHARRMFPCHDHPKYKARYTVRIMSGPETGLCLSNMPLRHYQVALPSGMQTWLFETSVPFSTYLVALALAQPGLYAFDVLRVPRDPKQFKAQPQYRDLLLRCFLPAFPSSVRARREALQFLADIVHTIEGLLLQPFWLPKLDMIGLAFLRPAAMENPGLITFRTQRLQYPLSDATQLQAWKDAASLFDAIVKRSPSTPASTSTPASKLTSASSGSSSKPISTSAAPFPPPPSFDSFAPSPATASSVSSVSSASPQISVPSLSEPAKLRRVEEFEAESESQGCRGHRHNFDSLDFSLDSSLDTLGDEEMNLEIHVEQLRGILRELNKTEWNKKQKRDVLKIIAHEVVHQWFGNLITCEGWDQIFWNEAWATYWSFYVLDKLYPDWKVWHFFIYQDYFQALSSEMQIAKMLRREDLHPVVTSPEYLRSHANAVEGVFDFITYSKGAVVLRTVESLVGDDVMLAALRSIFAKYRGGTMNLDIFLQEVDLAYTAKVKTVPQRSIRAVPDSSPSKSALASKPLESLLPSVVVRPWFERVGFPTVQVRFAPLSSESAFHSPESVFKLEICQCFNDFFINDIWGKGKGQGKGKSSGKEQSTSNEDTKGEELRPGELEESKGSIRIGPQGAEPCFSLRRCIPSGRLSPDEKWKIPLFVISEMQMEGTPAPRKVFPPKPQQPVLQMRVDNTSVLTTDKIRILLFVPLGSSSPTLPRPLSSASSSSSSSSSLSGPTASGAFPEMPRATQWEQVLPEEPTLKKNGSGRNKALVEICIPGEGVCGKTPTVWKLNSRAMGYYTTVYSMEVIETYVLPQFPHLSPEDRTHFHQEVYLGFRNKFYSREQYISILQVIRQTEKDAIVVDSILTRLRMLVLSSLSPSDLKNLDKIREGLQWCRIALEFGKPFFEKLNITTFVDSLNLRVRKAEASLLTEEKAKDKDKDKDKSSKSKESPQAIYPPPFAMSDQEGYLFQSLLNHYLFFHYRTVKLAALLALQEPLKSSPEITASGGGLKPETKTETETETEAQEQHKVRQERLVGPKTRLSFEFSAMRIPELVQEVSRLHTRTSLNPKLVDTETGEEDTEPAGIDVRLAWLDKELDAFF